FGSQNVSSVAIGSSFGSSNSVAAAAADKPAEIKFSFGNPSGGATSLNSGSSLFAASNPVPSSFNFAGNNSAPASDTLFTFGAKTSTDESTTKPPPFGGSWAQSGFSFNASNLSQPTA